MALKEVLHACTRAQRRPQQLLSKLAKAKIESLMGLNSLFSPKTGDFREASAVRHLDAVRLGTLERL